MIAPRPGGSRARKVGDDDLSRSAQAVLAGATLASEARRLGVHSTALAGLFRRHRPDVVDALAARRRERSARVDARTSDIARQITAGASLGQVGERLGLPATAVGALLKLRGLRVAVLREPIRPGYRTRLVPEPLPPLRAWRTQRSLSQGELAHALGVRQSVVREWELGLKGIRHPHILALALEALDLRLRRSRRRASRGVMPRWTAEELRILDDHPAAPTRELLSRLPGRTLGAVAVARAKRRRHS